MKGNLLFYFDKPGDKEPNGVIILEGHTVELAPTGDEFTFHITFNCSNSSRKYIIQAENQRIMEDWMKVITCASYDYMRLMVAELKAQLDELTTSELSQELKDCKARPQGSTDLLDLQLSDGALAATDAQANPSTHGTVSTVASTRVRLNPFDVLAPSGDLDPFGQVSHHYLLL